MAIWKVNKGQLLQFKKTNLITEKYKEADLENWIISEPSILEEPLFIIGQQVRVEEVKDSIDILALDLEGNTVIVELKRDETTSDVDFQSLKYASYVSRWENEQFVNIAKEFQSNPDYQFKEEYEKFCKDNGKTEIPDINDDQRMIIIGAKIKDKLGSVALWLLNHGINIKIMEFKFYNENGEVIIEPTTLIPLPVNPFETVGEKSSASANKPWKVNGEGWHKERCMNKLTLGIFNQVNEKIKELDEVKEPAWNQKLYISYSIGSKIWLTVHTDVSSYLELRLRTKKDVYKVEELASRLNLIQYDIEATNAKKMSYPSSIFIDKEGSSYLDIVTIKIKEGYNLNESGLLEFISEAYREYLK